jgi:hypothetical protein
VLINEGIPQGERLMKLNQIAIQRFLCYPEMHKTIAKLVPVIPQRRNIRVKTAIFKKMLYLQANN